MLDVHGDPTGVDVLDVTHDSVAVAPGSLFCCLPGKRRDGHEFAAAAVDAGAVAVLVERALPDVADVPQVVVADARGAMAVLAAEVHGRPAETLSVVGVTGTNGKTTTTFLVRAILEAAGRPTGLLGTMSGSRTTPEAPVLQAALAGFVAEGKVAAAIEVSSGGLVARRVEGMRFAAAIFTGLSQDHLDDHGTMDAYFEAKALLFTPERTAVAVVNADDEWGRKLLERAPVPMRPYSMADAVDLELRTGSASFTWDGERVELPLDGDFNVSNALAAATACRELGVSAADVARGLGAVGVIAGHGEAVDAGQDFRVVVDYAHTPLALESVLKAARDATTESGKVIAVFGCGGDRDPTKRAPMGWAASCEADVAIITSDNPRSEDPDAIIATIVEGATGGALVLVEPDRRAAIALAFARASAGDVVVLAGKGHETGQVIGDTVVPFDDKAVAIELLRGRGASQ